MTAVRRGGSGSPPRVRGAGCLPVVALAEAGSQRPPRRAANQTSGGRGRVGFILAAAAYGAWLAFLAVLAVIQKFF